MTELPLQGEGLAVEPVTEAGRRMLYDWQARRTHPPTQARQESYRQFIVAIEREAYRLGVRDGLAALQAEPSPETVERVDVERLGFADLLAVGRALLEHYPPDTIVCSHSMKADPGAQTAAAIADLIESCARLLDGADDDYEPRPL